MKQQCSCRIPAYFFFIFWIIRICTNIFNTMINNQPAFFCFYWNNLKVFFRKHGSPLYDFADVIVRTSDNYGFDYRLLPAIAMQESTLCRAIPENSHNCWGWGIYGNIVTRFDSYEEAIEIVAKGIKTHYLDKGLTTASTIMAKYTPSSPEGAWAKSVNQFLRALE